MINIQDIIPFMKKGWVAMDKDGTWLWYDYKPVLGEDMWELNMLTDWSGNFILNGIFDIAPADDWTKSLIKVGGK